MAYEALSIKCNNGEGVYQATYLTFMPYLYAGAHAGAAAIGGGKTYQKPLYSICYGEEMAAMKASSSCIVSRWRMRVSDMSRVIYSKRGAKNEVGWWCWRQF